MGVPCGIMDQFSSVFGSRGHLILIDCKSNEYELIPFDRDDATILIVNSSVNHELSGSEYSDRRSDCDRALAKIGKPSWRDVVYDDLLLAEHSLSHAEFRRSQHVVSEIERTIQAANSLRVGELEKVGELMFASHRSLRDDFEVSCTELDTLVEIANDIGVAGGVYGSRMTGGGFGGCTVSLVRKANLAKIAETLQTRYQQATGLQANWFSSSPAEGALFVEVCKPQQ